MICPSRIPNWAQVLLIVLSLVGLTGLMPSRVWATTLTIRNDTPMPVIVNTTYTLGNKVYPNRPVTLRMAEVSQAIPRPGDMVVTIHDARMANQLFQGALRNDGRALPLYYSIRPDPKNPGKVLMFRLAEPPRPTP